jgi:hypothetical protein
MEEARSRISKSRAQGAKNQMGTLQCQLKWGGELQTGQSLMVVVSLQSKLEGLVVRGMWNAGRAWSEMERRGLQQRTMTAVF